MQIARKKEVVNFILEKAKNHLVDVHPIGAVTKRRDGEILAPIAELVQAGAVGFSDDGVAVKSAVLVRKAFAASLNIISVLLYQKIGGEPIADFA